MFYSHQLLARKAPLGQIWMAATLNSKMNRKKLDKLDIIQICEEILNPAAPMALRLSGILMGGVVKVYYRKVELLYGDLSRLVLELNDTKKVKLVSDPTILPKGKANAKYEAVTLPAAQEHVDTELEQTLRQSNTTTFVRFDHMRLDDIDDQYVKINIGDDVMSDQHHQADLANITLFDNFSSDNLRGSHYDRFERFDLGEEEINVNFTEKIERTILSPIIQSPIIHNEEPKTDNNNNNTTTMPSSPHEPNQGVPTDYNTSAVPSSPQEPNQGGGSSRQQDEQGIKEMDIEEKQVQQNARKKRKCATNSVILDDQILVPNVAYQSWLRDPSDILSKRRKVNEVPGMNGVVKLSDLLDLPPVGIMTAFEKFPSKFYYPKLIIDELWKKNEKLSPGVSSPKEQAQANIPDERSDFYPQDLPDFIPEMYQDGSAEIMRNAQENSGRTRSSGTITPGSPGHAGSVPSSGSGPTLIPDQPEILPSRRSRKRHASLSGSNHLTAVQEENELAFNLRTRMSEKSQSQPELLVETGPTQTPLRGANAEPSLDAMTESIKKQLKEHFETPGAPQKESLQLLTHGMKARSAAKLFYQTCVLATANYIKVEQAVPYGDILISRGPKM